MKILRLVVGASMHTLNINCSFQFPLPTYNIAVEESIVMLRASQNLLQRLRLIVDAYNAFYIVTVQLQIRRCEAVSRHWSVCLSWTLFKTMNYYWVLGLVNNGFQNISTSRPQARFIITVCQNALVHFIDQNI